MEEEFNGFKFVPTQSTELFNPTLSSSFLGNLDRYPSYATTLLNLRGQEARREELVLRLYDLNTQVSDSVLDFFAENKSFGESWHF